MRVAVISDVHGNRLALEAVLEDIEGQAVGAIVNLGDVVSGPMDPAGVAALLVSAAMPTIKGNHERWLFGGTRELDDVDHFVLSTLAPRDVEWLTALPATLNFGERLFLCHGTPASDTEPWLDNWWTGRDTTLPDEESVAAQAEGYDFPVLLCGHTHLARAVRLRDGRLIVNPGSVGLQINHGSPDARYAIVEDGDRGWSVSLRAVPYDHQGAARQAAANGFPNWVAALETGWVGPEGLF